MKTTEPIRNKKQLAKLLEHHQSKGETRNHLLITLCVHTALRISDILNLTTNDVYDFKNRKTYESITITEMKTGKHKTIALHINVRTAISMYISSTSPGLPLILNTRTNKAISRVQAYRIIRAAAEAVGLTNNISCHSLRKTFGYHAWKGGVSPAVIMEIYNHSSLAVTRRYLGVSQDDKDDVYLSMKFVA